MDYSTLLQVRKRLHLSSCDDLLSLMASVPHWNDGVVCLRSNRWCYPPGGSLTLSLAGERYISDALPDDAICWVEREDFKYAGRYPATTRPYTAAHWSYNGDDNAWFSLVPSTTSDAGIKVNTNRDATITPATTPMTPAPPPAVELTACGWYSLRSVTIEEDSATLCLAPPGSPGHPVLPLYLRLPCPLPDALAEEMVIRDDGVLLIEERLASSTSDAEQLHDVNTAPVGQPPAEKATSAQHTRFTETDFFGAKGENAMRRTLAVMVGDVIGGTGITGPQQLPNVYAELRRGGAFRDVMNSWVGELPPDMQDNVTRIAGIRAGDWSAYDKEPDSRENMMRMIWLCLAYLVGLPEAHDAEARTIARNVRRAGERYCEPRSSKPSPVRIVTGTTIGKWAQSYLNIGEK
ncbi:hypothetical protein ABL554_000598 [Escherichia coli]|uniref:hypothetical protein n=1 Tax=Escherichia coli TaxID=562 RepID=UPI001076857F|nr:hypothetical protein [Escherichia coli]EET6466923.1 hypothetical protein [Escherichia coli]EFA6210404.1 hypothetical protein [Escherichia coli]EFK6806607.1 hypothetical protein [Escherichia coli]EJK8603421.1 hypothetical protein [Escherichia coli]EJK8833880.1 hypothetical protein [Escherichia coli]